LGIVAEYFFGRKKEVEVSKYPTSFVDVRDVAVIHVRALQKGKVSDGKRLIASAGPWTHQMIVDIIRKRFPETRDRIPIGKPGENYHVANMVDGKNSVEILGVEYTPLEKTIIDTCNSIKHLSAA
jgi:NADPH-dependent methylglyoxal reductase